MGKIAFVFSGQGDQFSGMGKELYESYPCAKKIYEICDSLRAGTSAQCFGGSEEELKETKNTQPCLFATELAFASVLTENGIVPDAVAGFSLGEVAACAFSGAVGYEDGFKLVCRRGEFMQEEADRFETSMAAVLKLSAEKVRGLCAVYDSVYPVNFNCPGQVSVAGLTSQMQSFYEDVKAAGGRALPLKVKGAFHSPFMNKASEKFARELDDVEFNREHTVLYSNVTSLPYNGNAAELLSKQICSPVRWEEIIRNMIASGIDTFIEIGPGKTLTNMIGRVDTGVKRYSVCELSAVLSEVKPC